MSSETIGPAFQPDEGSGGFQPDEGLGGFQTALVVVGGGTHWAPQAFHASHFRAGHWIEEAFVPEPPSLVGRHWVTQAFHATHWGLTHWHEGAGAAPPLDVAITGDLAVVIGLDGAMTGPIRIVEGGAAFTLPVRRHMTSDLGVVVALDGRMALRRRVTMPGQLTVRPGLAGRMTFRDRIAIEDDELLLLGLV